MGATQPAPAALTVEALRALLDAVPQGLVIVNEHDETVYANPLARELLGDSPALGEAVVLGGDLRVTSFVLEAFDGLSLLVLTAATPTEHTYGETGPEQHLHEIEAIAQLGSWRWDLREDALDWSDGLYRLYGLEPQSVPITFAAFVTMLPPEIRDRIVDTIEHCAETGDGYTFTTRTRDRSGAWRWRHSRANTVTIDGQVTRMFGTSQDVTERMVAEEELRASLEQADRLARENEALRGEVEAQLREMRASRSRILRAGDVARQRLARDLREGAQRRLSSVASILRSACDQVDPVAAPDLARTLAQAMDELEAGTGELGTLARGLHPAVLTDEGLVAALGALTSRSPVPVSLRTDSLGTLPSAIEAAAYFVVAEALTNVVKHAWASHAQVTVRRLADGLQVEVSDDGIGGAAIETGSGLRGMSDRVAALGGSLRMISPPQTGTLLRAELPFEPDSTAVQVQG
ncbi:MAG: PAS domain-containing protein [Solirubrobacterales bacterium]|nr:PAS domain-containing protein [Solirubrobacterales bacterium]